MIHKNRMIGAGLIIIAVFYIASCSDILDIDPTDTITEGQFWQVEDHAISSINGVYAVTRGHIIRLNRDNTTPNSYNNSGQIQLAEGTHTADNINEPLNEWRRNYRGIGRANNLLGKIDQIEMDEDLKQRIIGEALYLRAFFYHDLVRLFGGVPLILDPPDFREQEALPRNGKDEIIGQILSDLDQAIAVLPDSYSGQNLGRATRGAALGLKARVLLYESRWDEAAQTANEVIEMGEYSLFPDYRELFMLENQNNEEVIFDAQFKDPEHTHGYDLFYELQYNISPLKNLVDSYLMIDGMSIEESPLFDQDNPYENRDPRLDQTIVREGTMYNGQIVPEDKQFGTGYGFKKNATYEDDVFKPENRNSDLNYIILRYADILLMYAEAQNEVSGPDESIYDALNQIRDRAGMPDIPQGLSQDEMRDVIRHERRIELANEGLYLFDIRRWRIAHEVMNTDVFNNKGEVVQSRSFNPERDYLWPIHTELIDDNPALEQNPGY